MRKYMIIAVMLVTTPAWALDDMARMTLANSLGAVIAAETFCGLTYDQPAIAAFIEASVPADDMDFPPLLNGMIEGHRYQQDAMSTSAKTAHCTQIGRVAHANGFTP